MSEEGKLYSDLLRTVKNHIDEHSEKANSIKCKRKTKDAKVLTEMKNADQTETEGIRSIVTKSGKSIARVSSGPREEKSSYILKEWIPLPLRVN